MGGGTGDTGSIKYKKDAWEEGILHVYIYILYKTDVDQKI